MIDDEHFSPSLGLDLDSYIQAGDLTGAHHLARYLWLLDALHGMPAETKLLDAGCGAGYGSHLIATSFPEINVLGVDYDPVAIEEASKAYVSPNLSFRRGDLMQWNETIGTASFDLIVSFDSIEHIPHREIAMENIVYHLKPDGRLILSTPCGMPDTNLSPEWSAHRIEYGTASLYDFLSRYFRVIHHEASGSLPSAATFQRFRARGLHYVNTLNPVVCESPIQIVNPFRA